MTITRVRVAVREGDPKFRATATVCFDDCFVIREVKVIQGQNGMFISMPSRRNPDGSFSDIAHPITVDCRKMIEGGVLEEYERELQRVASGESQVRKVTSRPRPPHDGPGGDPGLRDVRRFDRGARGHSRPPHRAGNTGRPDGPPRLPAPPPSVPPPPSAFDPSRDISIQGSYGPKDEPPAREGGAPEDRT